MGFTKEQFNELRAKGIIKKWNTYEEYLGEPELGEEPQTEIPDDPVKKQEYENWKKFNLKEDEIIKYNHAFGE